jgi:flavorubredoxin
MASINEIAPDVFRICTYVPEIDLQFNQFLVKDDEPLLYHTGMKALFPQLLETMGKILEPSTIRWMGFSHFEADECGALNNWLEARLVFCRRRREGLARSGAGSENDSGKLSTKATVEVGAAP